MIEVSHLTKQYGNHLAVDDVSFTVADGQICGLLGPNGAGKSTIMNILTGYLSATSGQVTVAGHPLPEEADAAKACVGYLPEQPPLYPEMTVQEYLDFAAELKGVKKAQRREQVQQAADGAAKADEQYQKAKQELHLLREKLGNAEAQKAAAEKELSELRDRPVEVAVEVDEKAVEEAITAARAKNDAEWAEKMAKVKNELSEAGLKAEKLKAKIKKAEEKAAASAAELEKLKKSQTLSDPNTAVFKQIFEQVQEDFNKLHGSLLKVRASDPDTAEKLTAAVRALVDKMQGALNG